MKHVLTDNLGRVSFHDSYIENISRSSTTIQVTFNWAKINNYHEENITEGIIISRCLFTLKGVTSEKFRLFDNSSKQWIAQKRPDNFEQHFREIGENKIEDGTYVFSGAFTPEIDYFWTEWLITFKQLRLEWNNHISHNDWKNGKSID